MNSPAYNLPDSSLVGVSAHRLKFPKFVWRNQDVGADVDLRKYAFASPHPGDPAERFIEEVGEFWSDRYGGEGVGSNGGSGRCGADDIVQIKGIGQTSLVGSVSDKVHSNGGASLNEAIRETIWSEIYNALTPFGASRVLGIIDTNTTTPSFDGRSAGHKRALILREVSIRPAHFMRAVSFQNTNPWMCGPGVDARRTRSAVETFHLALCCQLGYSPKSGTRIELINNGLVEMFRRFAKQVAVIQSKRIPHCALNCSNICLDGKLIDFGTASTVRGYKPYRLNLGGGSFFSEEKSFIPTLHNLHFYLTKYLSRSESSGLISLKVLIDDYLGTHRRYVAGELVKLTGLPVDVLKTCTPKFIENFSQAFTSVVVRQVPTTLNWEEAGADDLTRILPDLAFCSSPQEADRLLASRLPDDPVRHKLIESYFSLREECVASSHATVHSFTLYSALNCLRLNIPMHMLFRLRFRGRVEALVLGTNSSKRYADFIDDVVSSSVNLGGDADSSGFRLDFLLGHPSRMTLSGACTLDGIPISETEVLSKASLARNC